MNNEVSLLSLGEITDFNLLTRKLNFSSEEEINEWLQNCLQEGIWMILQHDWDQGPVSFEVANLYEDKRLDDGATKSIRKAILGSLRDLSENPDTKWKGYAADTLIVTASQVFYKGLGGSKTHMEVSYDEKSEFFEILVGILDQDRFREVVKIDYPDTEVNLHARTLQALVSLRYKANIDFWEPHYLADENYADGNYEQLIFMGMAHGNIADAFSWAQDKIKGTKRDSILPAVLISLPVLVHFYGKEKVQEEMNGFLNSFSPEDRLDFKKEASFLDELELGLKF